MIFDLGPVHRSRVHANVRTHHHRHHVLSSTFFFGRGGCRTSLHVVIRRVDTVIRLHLELRPIQIHLKMSRRWNRGWQPARLFSLKCVFNLFIIELTIVIATISHSIPGRVKRAIVGASIAIFLQRGTCHLRRRAFWLDFSQLLLLFVPLGGCRLHILVIFVLLINEIKVGHWWFMIRKKRRGRWCNRIQKGSCCWIWISSATVVWSCVLGIVVR